MTLITTTDDLAALCSRLRRRANSSPSTPSSCASGPTGRSSAWCSSPGADEVAAIDALAPGPRPRAARRAAGRSGGAEGVPRRAAGHRDLRPALRRGADAAVRHPGRRHGVRASATRSATRRWSPTLAGGAHRQGAPLHRLGGRPLSASADHLRRRRRDPSARRSTSSLRARLEQDGRLDWVAEEMAVLTDPATYRADPETLWERLRPRSSNRRLLGVLRAIAAWREREAQRVNIPRQRLLKDETLLEIAATAPADAGGAGARPRHQPRLRRGPHGRGAAGRHRRGEGAAGGGAAAAGPRAATARARRPR